MSEMCRVMHEHRGKSSAVRPSGHQCSINSMRCRAPINKDRVQDQSKVVVRSSLLYTAAAKTHASIWASTPQVESQQKPSRPR